MNEDIIFRLRKFGNPYHDRHTKWKYDNDYDVLSLLVMQSRSATELKDLLDLSAGSLYSSITRLTQHNLCTRASEPNGIGRPVTYLIANNITRTVHDIWSEIRSG